ncbi:hypothetical protein AALO_G00239020 [Alosa alosa]|uniref:Uncharacterized protein n=1 Tax=Alosa alosa TaxID=278164 RepID=A0AAV6FW29_9TELE|nr:hypothetical protein AALO_G00239020 [Alosa alosa]
MLNLDGLEVIAVLVVMGLFVKVLEQFGLFEPVGGEALWQDDGAGFLLIPLQSSVLRGFSSRPCGLEDERRGLGLGLLMQLLAL